MFATDQFEFEEFENSFLVNTLLDDVGKGLGVFKSTKCTTPNLLNSLSSVSALYLYTGLPPLAYGSQAPKVAETVLRAYSFDHNEEDEKVCMNVCGYDIHKMVWSGPTNDFPLGQIHGNFLAPAMYEMCRNFVMKYCSIIDQTAEKTIDFYMNSNADLLTKGRQTCCPLMDRSVPAAQAYKEMYNFLKENTEEVIFSGLEWIRAFCILFDKDEVIGTRKREVEEEVEEYNEQTKQTIIRVNKYTAMRPYTYGPGEATPYVIQIATTFESYLKSMERAHKDRRAIASANMILRMFLSIIEDFHLELGKLIDGSTISIGGEMKKQKIAATLNCATLTSTFSPCIIQGTEDATKWNECLSPALFAMMHKAFFDIDLRDSLGLQRPSKNGLLFQSIAVMGNFLMSMKRIKLGPGPLCYSDLSYNRVPYTSENLHRFNDKTKEWLSKCEGKIAGNFLDASPGMLMGMLNAASTTIGLLASNFKMDESIRRVITLRSSDDSMTVYIGQDWRETKACVAQHKVNLEMISINLSTKKTLFFPKGYGEYTSWYQDGNFVAQYGVETSSIRPQGQNPPDDFHSVAKGVATSLQTLTINPLGATVRLRLGIDGCRRLWRIQRNLFKRKDVSHNALVLSDGGKRPWHFANCHLEETVLREIAAGDNKSDKSYLRRIRNPENPFNRDPDSEVVFSKEHGQLVMENIENPRTVFHFVKRSNRTINTESKKKQIEEEEANSEAIRIIHLALPQTYIRSPTTSNLISSNILASLSLMASDVEMTPEEQARFDRAKQVLSSGQFEDEAEEEVEYMSDSE